MKSFGKRARLVSAAALVIAALALGVAGLFWLTAITMTVTFMVGVPLMAAGILLYLSVVIQDLRDHKVL